ncbi:E3 ubiquitin-protein ligase TRIM39-like [Ambystoma mexicanum]|uniref:E3 ubiquitin-protein ligase TRIM39-like n=1 Tax=Ambystoma mexicanum TaxID=8296 RepID=UPI0037E922C1
MAAEGQVQNLKAEVTCSICLEFFKDPVIIDCGHNFCRPCIAQCWEGTDELSCPQCREPSLGRCLRPNRQLGNIVEMLKQFHLPAAETPEGALCTKHEEKLKLFCEEDLEMICLVCRESKVHKTHTVSPIEEAAQEYKSQVAHDYSTNRCPTGFTEALKKRFQIRLEQLKKELVDIQEWKTKEEKNAADLEAKFKSQRENILSTFEDVEQFLKEEKQRLLGNLDKEQEENVKKIQGKVAVLAKQQQSHGTLITEIEEKFQQQDIDLLRVVRSVLFRSKMVRDSKPKDDSEEMKKNVHCFSLQHTYLKERFTGLKEKFRAEMDIRGLKSFKVAVALDPKTANPSLVLSDGLRRVKHKARYPSDNTRFCCVGSRMFTSGRHYWEVELLHEGRGWEVGVAEESLIMEEKLSCSHEWELWGMGGYDGHYKALTFPKETLLLNEKPKKLGVYLDYERGRLSLYNAETPEHIYTFTNVCVTENILPVFHLWPGAEMSLA